MDKETIFFTIFIILYVGNQIGANNLLNMFNKFNIKAIKFIDFYNIILNPMYFSEEEDEDILIEDHPIVESTIEKPVLKYEDKFLDDIRKLEKEYIFTEEEKWIEKQKIAEFLNKFTEEDDKKSKEFTEEISDNEIKLIKYQNSCNKEEQDEEEQDEEEQDEEEQDEEEQDEEQKKDFFWIDKDDDEDDYLGDTIEDRIATLLQTKDCITKKEKEFKELIVSDAYFEKKMKKAEELARKCIIDKRVDRLENSYIMESTPLGNVLMKYDKDKESFTYYSDNSIPYRYLEVVARKFVKQFNFRPIFVDMEEELKLTEEKWDKEKHEKEEKVKEEKKKKEEALINGTKSTVEEKKNVFAKFKSYNKESGTGHVISAAPPKNSIPNKRSIESQENEKILLKQRANRYTYEGKFANFNFLKKIDKKVVDKKLAMSFAEFKKTILNK